MGLDTIDPRTPVLVGVGTAEQRLAEAGAGVGELELMARAVENAGEGLSGGLLRAVGRVLVPRGTWRHGDPGRWLADRLGLVDAHPALAELGVLQQSLLTRASADLAAGRADAVLVVGGEAAHRRLRARIAGLDLADPVADGVPDTVWAPGADILARVEIDRHLAVPARQYAILESAIGAARGLSPAAGAREIATLYADFSAVAAEAGHSIRGRALAADELLTPTGRNAWLASPYTKWHCSQLNVDQAAALLLCTVETARRFGVPRERWVFPTVAAEANTMVPVVARPDPDRSPGFAAIGAALGPGVADVRHVDLYSCFPAAVRIQQHELGLTGRAGRELTVTGGMAFAGGPLNNHVLRATVEVARRVRAEGGDGLVTSVSGMVTKQAGALWSARPAAGGFRAIDVSAELPSRPVDADYVGPARVVGCTVAFDQGAPTVAIVVVEGPHGVRSVATSTAPDLLASMRVDPWVGRPVRVNGGDLSA
ncbi:acetyl-CoA acetyltransferase [Embleya sp. AB8]|uniref:acetyl-CoA acetyltransferase n=1 Tax=Embleya sp. AB8 TaxID=3156304 RepID=UPI003C726646